MQNYKSLCAAATVCATLVNIQHPDRESQQFDQLDEQLSYKMLTKN